VAFVVERFAPESFVPIERGYTFRELERTGSWWRTAWEPLLPVACVVLAVLALRRLRREPVAAWLVLSVGCFVSFSVGFTAWMRFDECADFRFVYALLVPLASLFGLALSGLGPWGRRGLMALGGTFAVFSAAFVFLQFPL
jgi:cytochrome bd-type quinol oxidase subunit 2